MPTNSYEVVRNVLEAEGWTVGPCKRRVFEAEHGDEKLTVIISGGPAPEQIAAAYKRLLIIDDAASDRRVAIVLPQGPMVLPEISGSLPRMS